MAGHINLKDSEMRDGMMKTLIAAWDDRPRSVMNWGFGL